jgi:hypothetical protein
VAKIITIEIEENGDANVDLAGFQGKGCHAIQEAFSRAFGGTSKETVRKPEFNKPLGNNKCIIR